MVDEAAKGESNAVHICGQYYNFPAGYEFLCFDMVDRVHYYCWGTPEPWKYVCWDGAEWEYANYWENDGTPD